MLFVQYLTLTYQKDMRYANYAQIRNSFKFLQIRPEPMDFYPKEINKDIIFNCEVLYQKVSLLQKKDGIKKYRERFKKFNDEIFTAGSRDTIENYSKFIDHIRMFKEGDIYKIMFCNDNYFWMSLKRRGHNETYNDKKSPFSYTDVINETAFKLKPNEYGRIIYNDRIVDHDTGKWYYQLNICNFISCDKSDFREKMFFKKVPDYEYKNMQYLKYC